jgi:O-Antigen ligase
MIKFVSAGAQAVLWAFFLLIATKFLEFFALVHNSPVRPFEVYSLLLLAATCVIAVHCRSVGFRHLCRNVSDLEIAVFTALALLVCLIAASVGGNQPDSLRFKIWPAANLLMAGSVFYFARLMGLRRTIIAAATCAFSIEIISIFIDLWIPGAFAEWAPRPAGLPQNSNNGALLATFLLAFLLPNKLKSAPSRSLLPALLVAFPLVFVTLSRSGLVFYLLLTVSYATVLTFSATSILSRWRVHAIFTAMFIPCVLFTAAASPTLHGNVTAAIWRSRVGFSVADILPNATNQLAKNAALYLKLARESFSSENTQSEESTTPQEILDSSINMSDDTVSSRLEAARFFWNVGLQHPLSGVGTGYGYSFKTGPHNMFSSLVAEQGFPALILYIIALALLAIIAIRRLSPFLLAVTLIGGLGSLSSHTILVEPGFLIFVCAALGSTAEAMSPRPGLIRRRFANIDDHVLLVDFAAGNRDNHEIDVMSPKRI